jgi:hypothetical protein
MSEQAVAPQADQKAIIAVALLQEVLNYLAEKPYKETSVLIARIQTTVKLQESEEAPTPPTDINEAKNKKAK